MADKINREKLYDLVKGTLPNATASDVEKLVNGLEGSSLLMQQTKEATRTKTFRFPTDILEWLEQKAASNGRSPNAELVELMRNAKAAS